MKDISDEELLRREQAAREAAHTAPLAPVGERHTGERHILEHTSAWADRSREWMELRDEVKRRGL